jgi:hypothetical protein
MAHSLQPSRSATRQAKALVSKENGDEQMPGLSRISDIFQRKWLFFPGQTK